MTKITLNFTKQDLNYCSMKPEGSQTICEFPLDLTPTLWQDDKEITLKNCKCKVLFTFKIKSKLVQMQDLESFTTMGTIEKLKVKDSTFEINKFEDWFFDTYYKRIDCEKDIEIIKILIISDDLADQVKQYVDKSDFDEKVDEVKTVLSKKIATDKSNSKMPTETKPPKIKGGQKEEPKKKTISGNK